MNSTVLQEDLSRFADTFQLFDEFKGHSFLITGATGLIGSIMTKCLIELSRYHQLNLSVFVCVRNPEKAMMLFADYPEAKLINLSLEELPSTSLPRIDHIIHFAAPTTSDFFVSHPVETFKTIVVGTDAVLQFALNNQARQTLYVSSMEVYGVLPAGVIATEDRIGYIDPSKPRSSYPLAKRAAESLCLNYINEFGKDIRIARLAQTFGAGISITENRVFAQFARSVINHQDIRLRTPGDSAHCYCYTTDAISALLHILARGESGTVYNVGNKDTYCSIKEMAHRVCAAFGTNSNVSIELDTNAPYPPSAQLKLDTSRLEALGWKPAYSLEEMYEKLIKYLSPCPQNKI